MEIHHLITIISHHIIYLITYIFGLNLSLYYSACLMLCSQLISLPASPYNHIIIIISFCGRLVIREYQPNVDHFTYTESVDATLHVKLQIPSEII